MPSNFTKQPQQLSAAGAGYLNGGTGDAVIGGQLTSVPSTVTASQGIQDTPGDRIILGMADALALSKTSVGTLYGGLYQYVTTYASSTATPTINRAAFWRTASADNSYTVTPDESGATGANLRAGVFINTLTAGNSWWIQVAGKVKVLFRAAISGIPSAGCAVYNANQGAGADVGTFDCLDGGVAPTFTQVGQMLNMYAGVAETLPANGTASVIDIPMGMIRW